MSAFTKKELKPTSSKTGLILFILGAGMCVLAVMCVIGLGVVMKLRGTFPPVYAMDQVDSEHEGYRRTTLISGNTVYVRDYEEYALISGNTQPPQMIGQLPFSEDAVSGVYAIPGQDPSAYVLEYDPMYQAVYRNIEHPSFNWREAEFQKIRLMFPTANPRESEDPVLIEEILNTLKGGNPTVVPMQADGNYSGVQNYALLLFTDQLPGMMVMAGVHVNQNGEVFLAEDIVSNQWMPPGPLFVEWIQK